MNRATAPTRLAATVGRLRMPRGRAARAAMTIAATAIVVACLIAMGSSLPRLDQIGHPNPLWLTTAILAEVASLLAYALIVREVLAIWRIRAHLPALLRATIGGIAIATTLPIGQALSLSYWYRQLRTAGANPKLAAFALLAAGAAGALSLALLLLIGIAVAGHTGPLKDARIPLLAAGLALLALLTVFRRPLSARARERLDRYGLTVPHDTSDRRRQLIRIAAFACLNWLLDCASLYAALLAVGAAVPIHGMLVTYAAAQIVNQIPLPLTAGGGTVELSLSLGLAAFGHTTGEVLAGILLFRLISCWGLVPIGWIAIATDNRRPTTRRTRRPSPRAPLEAEPLPVHA